MMLQTLKMFFILCFFISCRQRDNSAQEQMILEGMQRANEALLQDNEALGNSFERMEYDPAYAPAKKIYAPKLKKVKDLSNDLVAFIDVLIVKLDDGMSPEKVLQSEKGAHLLFRQLYYFKYNLLTLLDGQQQETLLTQLPVLPFIHHAGQKMPGQSYEQKWIDSAFGNSSSLMCQAMLNKIKNDVLISSQKMMLYFFNHLPQLTGRTLLPAIWFSASQVKPGDTITISAGLGEFIIPVQPAITIHGQTVQSENEIVEYKLKTGHRPGKYSFPVHFSYTRYDGSRETMVKTFSYTVVQ